MSHSLPHHRRHGYVPRPYNVDIAAALDEERALSAHIAEIEGRFGDPWQRLVFAIDAPPTLACPACTKLET